jgi:hypothetical protein
MSQHRKYIRGIGFLLLVICLQSPFPSVLTAQVAGGGPVVQDSTITFTPVVPLIGEEARTVLASQGAGVNLLFSGSGWAVGGFYTKDLGASFSVSIDAFFTTRRNADEFEDVYFNNIPVVSEKVNRVFNVPLSLSLRYRLFEESLQESFRPFLTAGATATAVMVTPYLQIDASTYEYRYYEFFESFAHASTSYRPGGFVGIGSNFGSLEKGSAFGVSVRYFIIPYGEPGVESLRNLPMTNFNGLFITLSIGSNW